MCDQPLATLDALSSISIDHEYIKLVRIATNLQLDTRIGELKAKIEKL